MAAILGDTPSPKVAKTVPMDGILNTLTVLHVPNVHVVFIVRLPKLSAVKNVVVANTAIKKKFLLKQILVRIVLTVDSVMSMGMDTMQLKQLILLVHVVKLENGVPY